MARRYGVDVGAGVIDADFRGEVLVMLFNHGEDDVKIKRGDRIAQLICEKIAYPIIEEVHEMDKSQRGSQGFGASGGM